MIVVNNNISLAYRELETAQVALFSPTVLSNNQDVFFKTRFQELQHTFPEISYAPVKDVREICAPKDGTVYAWDAYYEKTSFSASLHAKQNRLFSCLDFEMPASFTPFKNLAENILPSHFLDAIRPKDKQVLDTLDLYFSDPGRVLNYFETRNGMVGPKFSTKLSPFLSCGVLDVKYLYNRVKEFENENESNKSTYWIIFELLWREFFYWHYQAYPRVYFSENGLKGTPNFESFKKYSFADLHSLSPHPVFSSALNELEQTGFLSNRVRQIFASQWLNDLNLNWRSGAYLFEQQLIDYDVYSNYGNWMYLAGVGVDPRGRRYFNVEKQLLKYDPQNCYIKTWS